MLSLFYLFFFLRIFSKNPRAGARLPSEKFPPSALNEMSGIKARQNVVATPNGKPTLVEPRPLGNENDFLSRI